MYVKCGQSENSIVLNKKENVQSKDESIKSELCSKNMDTKTHKAETFKINLNEHNNNSELCNSKKIDLETVKSKNKKKSVNILNYIPRIWSIKRTKSKSNNGIGKKNISPFKDINYDSINEVKNDNWPRKKFINSNDDYVIDNNSGEIVNSNNENIIDNNYVNIKSNAKFINWVKGETLNPHNQIMEKRSPNNHQNGKNNVIDAMVPPIVRMTKNAIENGDSLYALSRLRDHRIYNNVRLFLSYFHNQGDICYDGITQTSLKVLINQEGLPMDYQELRKLYNQYHETIGIADNEVSKDLISYRSHIDNKYREYLQRIRESWKNYMTSIPR